MIFCRDSTGPSHIPFDRAHPGAGSDDKAFLAQVGGTSSKTAITVQETDFIVIN